MLFNAGTPGQRAAISKYVTSRINAPYVHSSVSTLGGVARASVMITVSLDKRANWHNDILQNSRYFQLSLDRDGTLEQFTVSHKLLRLRKSRVKSLPDAIVKINKYIRAAN